MKNDKCIIVKISHQTADAFERVAQTAHEGVENTVCVFVIEHLKKELMNNKRAKIPSAPAEMPKTK